MNAAGSYISMVRGNRPIIVRGSRNKEAAPSVMTFASGKSKVINTPTGGRLMAGPGGAVCSMGHLVKREFDRLAKRTTGLRCAMISGKRSIHMRISRGKAGGRCSPRRVSTFVLRGVGGATRSCLKRRIARTIVAIPTCFGSSRHRTAGSTNGVTNLSMGHVVGRPATTTLTFNFGGSRSGREAVTICSLNNNAFSVSVLRLTSNMFRILSAGNSAGLNNSS